LIIEDEPVIALDVAESVKSLGHRVTGVASRASGDCHGKKHPPGLILADIQLKDGSTGVMAVREILKSVEVPVVFVTAFSRAPLDGRSARACLRRHQTIRRDDLKVAISQALFFARAE